MKDLDTTDPEVENPNSTVEGSVQTEQRRRKVDEILIHIIGLLYVYVWVKRANVRALIERFTYLFLFGYLAFLFVEVLLELSGRTLATHSSLWFRAGFWALITSALFTKLREFGEHRQQLFFIRSAKQLVEMLNEWNDTEPKEAIGQLLRVFRKDFEMKGALNANYAEPDVTDKRLRVCFAQPDGIRYDPNISFGLGEGGAGYCYSKQCVVYFPWKRLRHAIIQDIKDDRPYSMIEDLYLPCSVEEFESVLVVPVTAYGKCYGVLNFDSKKGNAFRRLDFQQAMFYGMVLAQFLRELEIRRVPQAPEGASDKVRGL